MDKWEALQSNHFCGSITAFFRITTRINCINGINGINPGHVRPTSSSQIFLVARS